MQPNLLHSRAVTNYGIVFIAVLSLSAPCSLLGQSAQKLAEFACVQESQQEGASLWSTRTTKRKDGHVLIYRRLETVDGVVQKLLSVDGHTPDGAEKLKNDAVLHSLLTDAAARSKMAQTASSDVERMKQTLRIVPVMFIFEDKSNNGVTHVLSFRPDPAYKPLTYEARALHSLTGEVQLEVKSGRIRALDAAVSEPVRFGYGLLGSLTQGGTIHLRFVEVEDGIWKTNEVKFNIDGHIAMVKNLSKTEVSERDEFHRLPRGLTILSALDTLQVSR